MKTRIFILVTLALVMAAGCSDTAEFYEPQAKKRVSSRNRSYTTCIDGYKFAVVVNEFSPAMAQILPPQRCIGD